MSQGWQDNAHEDCGLDERRLVPRFELTVEVTYENRHDSCTAVSQDLSTGGLFVVTDSLLPVGECIRVRFSLPDSPELMDAIAEVRWTRSEETSEGEPGIGLAFLQLSAKTKQAIKAYVAKREAMGLTG